MDDGWDCCLGGVGLYRIPSPSPSPSLDFSPRLGRLGSLINVKWNGRHGMEDATV